MRQGRGCRQQGGCDLAFVSLAPTSAQPTGRPCKGADQVQPQAPEVGVRGAVAVLGPPGQVGSFRGLLERPHSTGVESTTSTSSPAKLVRGTKLAVHGSFRVPREGVGVAGDSRQRTGGWLLVPVGSQRQSRTVAGSVAVTSSVPAATVAGSVIGSRRRRRSGSRWASSAGQASHQRMPGRIWSDTTFQRAQGRVPGESSGGHSEGVGVAAPAWPEPIGTIPTSA